MKLVVHELQRFISDTAQIEVEYNDIPAFREIAGAVCEEIDEYVLGQKTQPQHTSRTRRSAGSPRRTPRAQARPSRPSSQRVKENVKEVLVNMRAPATTKEIATLAGTSPSTTSKALKELVREGEAAQAGLVPGVKGRRPLFVAS